MISSIHIGSAAAWQTILATSILGFCKNSNGILLSEVKSKAEAKLARALAFLFSSLGI